MACFIVPATEAIIASAAVLIIKKKEKKKEATAVPTMADGSVVSDKKIKFSRKLGWLCKLLWGGSFLLAFEHMWHGEVVPWFPFLTAMADPESTTEMLMEMGTVGVSMALIITAVWGGLLVASRILEKKESKKAIAPVEGETTL